MNSVLMTQVEYAGHRKVGRSAVSNWKKRELLVFAEGPDGSPMVDVTRSDARLNANVDPARGRPRKVATEPAYIAPLAPNSEPSIRGQGLGEVRSDLVKEQVTRERLRNAKDAGELVPMAEFERLAAETGRKARERVQAVMANLAERLAVEGDARKVRLMLAAEIDHAFGQLADEVVADEGAAETEEG